MIYDNLSNEELLKEVYLTQHKDRLLTIVCERLEMVMRELADVPKPDEFEDEIDNLRSEVDRLEGVLADSDDEVSAMEKRISDLESQLDSLTDDSEF
jgi:septal ring factor EnvC (AmiA/AmiB activator)